MGCTALTPLFAIFTYRIFNFTSHTLNRVLCRQLTQIDRGSRGKWSSFVMNTRSFHRIFHPFLQEMSNNHDIRFPNLGTEVKHLGKMSCSEWCQNCKMMSECSGSLTNIKTLRFDPSSLIQQWALGTTPRTPICQVSDSCLFPALLQDMGELK